MSAQTFRYRPSAIVRICLREVFAPLIPSLPIVLISPGAQYVGDCNARHFVQLLELLRPVFAASAFLYCLWRVYALHSTRIEFDGNELVWFSRRSRHGLLSSEVASSLSTPRILHIASGRPEYSLTIHSELDGFGGLSRQLNAWFPPAMNRLPAAPTQIVWPFLRNAALCLPFVFVTPLLGKFIGVFLRGISPGDMFYFAMAFPVVLAGVMALSLRRIIAAKLPMVPASQEPPAPYIVR